MTARSAAGELEHPELEQVVAHDVDEVPAPRDSGRRGDEGGLSVLWGFAQVEVAEPAQLERWQFLMRCLDLGLEARYPRKLFRSRVRNAQLKKAITRER